MHLKGHHSQPVQTVARSRAYCGSKLRTVERGALSPERLAPHSLRTERPRSPAPHHATGEPRRQPTLEHAYCESGQQHLQAQTARLAHAHTGVTVIRARVGRRKAACNDPRSTYLETLPDLAFKARVCLSEFVALGPKF